MKMGETKWRTATISEAALAIIAALAIALTMAFAAVPSTAYADAGKIEDGYVDSLLQGSDGNTVGWTENVITDSDAYDKSKGDGGSDDFVGVINSTIHSVTTIILWIVIALLGFRIAGRAVLGMMIDNASGSIDGNLNRSDSRNPSDKMFEGNSQIPTFFLTSKERGSKGKDKSVAEEGWFKDMLLESFKYLGFAVGVWIILGVIMSVIVTIFSLNPGGFDTFSFGGTSVTTF